MLTYTTLKISPSTTGAVDGSDAAACLAVIDGFDWAAVMTVWLETQEAPLPAVIFQPSADRKAVLHVSAVPGPESFYLQVLFSWDEKIGWMRSRKHVVSAELHDRDTVTRCLAALDAGRFADVAQTLNAEGTGVLN